MDYTSEAIDVATQYAMAYICYLFREKSQT